MSVRVDRLFGILSSFNIVELRELRDELDALLKSPPDSVENKARRLQLEKRARAAGYFDSGPVGTGACPYCGKR